MKPLPEIRKIIRKVLSEGKAGVPESVKVVTGTHDYGDDFRVEHHPGKDKLSWLGAVESGEILALSPDYITTHTISNKIPTTRDEAVKKILRWYRELDGIEVGKMESFPGGIVAEQTVAEGDGKAWVFMDEKGNSLGMYYNYQDKLELDSNAFAKLEMEKGIEALDRRKVGGLRGAAMEIFAELVRMKKFRK